MKDYDLGDGRTLSLGEGKGGRGGGRENGRGRTREMLEVGAVERERGRMRGREGEREKWSQTVESCVEFHEGAVLSKK